MTELQGHGLLNNDYLEEFMKIHRQKMEDRIAQLERRKPRKLYDDSNITPDSSAG